MAHQILETKISSSVFEHFLKRVLWSPSQDPKYQDFQAIQLYDQLAHHSFGIPPDPYSETRKYPLDRDFRDRILQFFCVFLNNYLKFRNV